MFQSTHPCGVRQEILDDMQAIFEVSIHAPVWGATDQLCPIDYRALFQSTHPCGVRRDSQDTVVNKTMIVSIHAPVWGATSHAF